MVDTARLPLPSTRRSERRLALLDSVLYPLIAERWRSPGGEDLVSMLLEVADSETGDGLTDKQVRDETISFFIAGHATIASALTWTWYLLSTHPTVWRKLRANVALCPYVTHRHPGFWDNPEGFEPERFAPEAARARHRMAFPFSAVPALHRRGLRPAPAPPSGGHGGPALPAQPAPGSPGRGRGGRHPPAPRPDADAGRPGRVRRR